MSMAALEGDNKLFRRGIRHDFVKLLQQDLKQVPVLTKSTDMLKQVKEMTSFLREIDTWENQVLENFLMIRRCISRWRKNSEYRNEMARDLEDIFEKIKKLKEEVPKINCVEQHEEPSDKPSQNREFEVGESSNNRINELDEISSPKSTTSKVRDLPMQVNCRTTPKIVELLPKFVELLPELNPQQVNCILQNLLHSLAIFPENAELKKRLLLHWWIGLGILSFVPDASIIENQYGEIFSLLEEEGIILIAERTRKHNDIADSYIINPAIHRLLISDLKGKGRIISKEMNGENPLHFYKDNGNDDVKAVLNVDQKHFNSKFISKSPMIKAVQLGRWCYPDQELRNELRETVYDVTNLNNHIEVDGTEFFKKLGETVTYLGLRGISRIKNLPELVGKMRDLKILDLKDCHSLQRLPHKPKPTIRAVLLNEGNLWFKELRHLDITGCYLLDHIPKWVCELSNLEVLKGAVFNGFTSDQCRVQDLSKLKNLLKLSIKLINWHFIAAEGPINLQSLKKLKILTIIWGVDEIMEMEKQSKDKVKDGMNIGARDKHIPDVSKDESLTMERQGKKNEQEKLKISGPIGKKLGLIKSKMVKEEKKAEKVSLEHNYGCKMPTISFPENLEKLDIRSYPNGEALELSDAARLKHLRRLYIRGGKLAKISGEASWQVEILRLRFLNFFNFNWFDLSTIFTKLEYVEYEQCPNLKCFPINRSPWIKDEDRPFPSHQDLFKDDDPISCSIPEPVKNGRLQLKSRKSIWNPSEKKNKKTMLGLEFTHSDMGRLGLDLVAVLDISGNMQGEKLEKMKTAMLSIIKKLQPVDRLSVVTFDTEAQRQCQLCQVTEKSRKDLEALIKRLESLDANLNTNTSDGLKMGLKVLEDRRFTSARATGIILVSGGPQTTGDAAALDLIGDVMVHTFAIGNYDHKELISVAHNSPGGTFSPIKDINELEVSLESCFSALLKVVVQDLILTIKPIKEDTTIKEVSAVDGRYLRPNRNSDGSIMVSLGPGFTKDVRKVSIVVHRPHHAISNQRERETFELSYTFRIFGEQVTATGTISEMRLQERSSNIAFFSTGRPPLPLDLFSCPIPQSSDINNLSDEEHKLTDGASYNYNGHIIPAQALKIILQRPSLASEATEADVDLGRLTGIIFVSERDHNLETLHIALRFKTIPLEVKVFSLADVFGSDSFHGVRMEDSGCIAGDHSLIYVSTKEPVQGYCSPWTAVYRTDLRTGYTERLTPPGTSDLSPSVSPSGNKVAVASFQSKNWSGEIEDLRTDIYIMNVRKSRMRLKRKRLIINGGWPTWGSEDVIFFHRKEDNVWGVFRFTISTSETIRVTSYDINAVTPAAIDENNVAVAIVPGTIKSLVRTGLSVERHMETYRHIEVIHVRTGKSVQITQNVKQRADHYNPFVIDGGKRIGYHRCNISLLENTNKIPRNFYQLPAPVEDVGLLRLSGAFATISKDGSKLAFVDNELKAVWLADSEGLRIIVESMDGNSFFSPMWNQNPEKDTLYVCAGPTFSAGKPVQIIAISNVSSGSTNRRQLTKGHFNNAFPSTNPAGTKLVFRSTRDGGYRKFKNLYIIEDAEIGEHGGKVRRLTEGNWNDTHCQWSPRGDWIVFSSTRDKPAKAPPLDQGLDPGFYAVYLVKASDSSVLVRVIASGYDVAGHVNHPIFSPDGGSIAVTTDLAAVSVDPISLPLFLHAVRPYGEIFTIDIDTDDIYKNENVEQFCRITHSRYENCPAAWTTFLKDDPNTQWNMVLDQDFSPACPYTYRDGGEGWHMTGHLCIEKRAC